MEWWRSWHGAPTDHKWAVIAQRAGAKVGVVSALAWALFDYASQNDPRGSIAGFDTETYAVYTGFDEREIIAVIQSMTDKGIVTDGILTNWEKRQPKREDNSKERVRKHREMKRNVTQGNAKSTGATIDSVSVSESILSLSENEKEKSPATEADVFKAYSDNIGLLTPMLGETIGDAIDEYGPTWCVAAIGKAVEQEKRSWAYVSGVLRGFKRDGFNTNHKGKNNQTVVVNDDGSMNV